MSPDYGTTEQPPSYRWPWFVWGAVVLGILLAVIWTTREVQRVRYIRDLNAPPPAETNQPASRNE